MIFYDKVTKTYNGGPPAVQDVTLTIEPGEFVSIVGHSGAGKTTLLKMLYAETQPTEGAIYFRSREIKALSAQELRELRRNIGTIFQDFRLLPTKTVYENIAFALEVAGKSDDDIAADVPHVLELVGLAEKLWSFPSELSGGEQQRIAIARAIVNQPDVLIADEPTGNLDPLISWEILQLLLRINELGVTVLMATHDADVVTALRRRVVALEDGHVIRDEVGGAYHRGG